MYDHDLEAHKQLYIMQSAVEQMQRAKIPYLFCPNTFTFKQTETNLKQPDHNNRQTISIAETQHNTNNYLWDFVPEENMLNEGISSALQGDHRRMKEQNLEHEPGGDYTHHLSPQAQEEWSNDHAIPKITSLLNL